MVSGMFPDTENANILPVLYIMQGNPITATCTAKATYSADYEAKGNLCIVHLN